VANPFIGYIGTYTKGESKGIYKFTLDTEKKELSEAKVAAELDNPTYVAISKDNQNLYSVVKDGNSGGLAVFSIDEQTGDLQSINQTSDGRTFSVPRQRQQSKPFRRHR